MKYDYGPLPRDVEEIQPGRMLLLLSLTALALLIYVGVLYNTQIVRHEEYLKLSSTSIVRRETVKASRGIITDRNGVTLISNGFAYDLTFDSSLLRKDQDVNDAILRLLQLCESQDRTWTDTLPITRDEPFAYTMEYLSLEQKRRFLTYLSSLKASRDRLGAYLQTHMDLVDAADLIEAAEAESAEQAEETPSTLERVLGIFKREKKTTNTGPLLPDGNKLLERLSAASLSPELLEEAGIPAADLLDWMAKDLGLPEDYIPWTVRDTGKEVDAAAREVITAAGYGEYFSHSFGHGVGVEIHESPNASSLNDKPLPAGAVISAEPGIYMPGKFGVRIEDVIVVGETASRSLMNAPKELLILA